MVTRDLSNRITIPFPAPPREVLRSLELLAILRRGDPDEMAKAGDLHNLPRPWEPATCPSDLRECVWLWCDQVAAWINHEFAWRPTQLIPPCWPRHAHIARELPVLAILRWGAEESRAPEPLEEWHRYTFPMFCDRLANRLGESGCRIGKHIDRPAESRYAAYVDAASVFDRQQVIYADSRPVVQFPRRQA